MVGNLLSNWGRSGEGWVEKRWEVTPILTLPRRGGRVGMGKVQARGPKSGGITLRREAAS